MEFTSNIVGTETPYFGKLGIPAVNASNEVDILGTPATIIRQPIDRSHWSAPDYVFGKEKFVRMSATRSEQKYSFKTDLQNWRQNDDFGPKNISMS